MSHEGAEREPETVKNGEVVREARTGHLVLDLPLVRTEPTDEEEDQTDAEVGEDDAHPYVRRERVHKRKDARFLLFRLLDHDADAEVHERFREVDDALAHGRDRQRRDGEVRKLCSINNLHYVEDITK